MKNKNILISYTYTPHSSSSFTLHNIKNDSRSNDPEELEVNKEDSCRLVEAGIASGWTYNTAYKNLIIHSKCWTWLIKKSWKTTKSFCIANQLMTLKSENQNIVIQNEFKTSILRSSEKSLSCRKISFPFYRSPLSSKLIEFKWMMIINEEKKVRIKLRRQAKKQQVPYNISEDHIHYAKRLMKLHATSKVTISTLRNT